VNRIAQNAPRAGGILGQRDEDELRADDVGDGRHDEAIVPRRRAQVIPQSRDAHH
jgi:hypothetical protein